MKQVMHRSDFGWLALCVSLCGVAHASASADTLKKVLAEVLSIQTELAIAEKRFSVMSREMAGAEKCAARELLGASISFRGDTEEARMIGRIVGEMKSADDERTVRKYLGIAAHRVVDSGGTDIQIVNQFLGSITTPAAAVQATVIRDKMTALRDIFQPYASKTY
jgi:hypothetical protein